MRAQMSVALDPRPIALDAAPVRSVLHPLLIVAAIVATACAASKPETSVDAALQAPAATRLDVAPAALHAPDAPGLNVEDLGAQLRDALSRSSGVEVVDEASVRRELAACAEAPCPDTLAERYRTSAFVVASSVSRIGETFLASVRVQRGAEELARTTAQSPDARKALTLAGVEAGVKLRAKLVEQGVGERVAAPDVSEPVETNEKDEAP